jgi:hypothetical protein
VKVVVELPPAMPVCFAVVMHHSQNRNLNRLGLNAHKCRTRAIDGHRNWRRICCLRTSPPCRPDNPLAHPRRETRGTLRQQHVLYHCRRIGTFFRDRHEQAFEELGTPGEAVLRQKGQFRRLPVGSDLADAVCTSFIRQSCKVAHLRRVDQCAPDRAARARPTALARSLWTTSPALGVVKQWLPDRHGCWQPSPPTQTPPCTPTTWRLCLNAQ